LVTGLPLAGNPVWWRSMLGIAVIPSILLAIGMTFSPESPCWLFQQGKVSQADSAVKRFYGKKKRLLKLCMILEPDMIRAWQF
jgi:hypothetical protein